MKAVTFLHVAVGLLLPMKETLRPDLCTSRITIMWNLPVHATATSVMRFVAKYTDEKFEI